MPSGDTETRPVAGSIWDALKPKRDAFEHTLAASLAAAVAEAPPAVGGAMGYSLLAPGKRLRPLLCILACEAAGGPAEAAWPAACAVEMVHTYSLIHDDLPAMDDDDLRRGRATCHKVYGEALAILAGDALLTMAFQLLAEGYAPRTAAVSCLELARGAGAVGMVGGQVLDLEADGKIPRQGSPGPGGIPGLEAIHCRKTGALFRSALRLGVYAAQAEAPGGADPATLAAVDRYAAAFGLAFQVADDLIDAEGDAAAAGKRVGKDAARGKLTYPGLLGVEASRARVAELEAEAVAAAGELGPAAGPLAELMCAVRGRDR